MKEKKVESGPRGSELQAMEWLAQVETEVRFVGDADGSPDFIVRFGGKEMGLIYEG